MVELALLLPVMVFGLIGAADLARAYALQLAVQNGARAGAEAYAIDYAKNQAQAITRARTEMSQTTGLWWRWSLDQCVPKLPSDL